MPQDFKTRLGPQKIADPDSDNDAPAQAPRARTEVDHVFGAPDENSALYTAGIEWAGLSYEERLSGSKSKRTKKRRRQNRKRKRINHR